MIAYRFHQYCLHICFLSLLFYGCMSGGSLLSEQVRKQVYVDANLLFEISYPEEWIRVQKQLSMQPFAMETTTWRDNNQNDTDYTARFSILSIAAARNPTGYAGLEKLVSDLNKEFAISSSEVIELPAGSARKIIGETPDEKFSIWLYLGAKRHYIINCSTATAFFEQYRKQFEQIADSFIPIG